VYLIVILIACSNGGDSGPGTDTTPPETSFTSSPASASTQSTATFEFTSSEANSSFEVSFDGGAYVPVRAADAAGNVDPTPATFNWTVTTAGPGVDTTPPETTILANPATLTSSSSASFEFESNESGSSFEVSVDGGAYIVATSPYSLTGLSDGAHTFSVRAIDAAANVDPSPASFNWTVDTVAPDTVITGSPATDSVSADATFEFEATEPGSILEVSIDGGAYSAAVSPHSLTGLSNGAHSFSVRAIDSAGNVDPNPAVYNWTVTLAPTIAISTCTPAAGDSTQNPDGSASFTRSHTVGSPTYHIVTPRQLADGTDVTMKYMVHEPAGIPKGMIVLIAGGALTAYITGVNDGESPTGSGGNFLVRSAHRYQSNGYRVITIDQPSDATSYGAFASDLDAYRNSMNHAVDIATIIQRENADSLNVIISGTSRGGISAAALNTLAAGIAMSSPVSVGAGQPVNSTYLPLTRIVRPSHLLIHTNDTCGVTLPSYSYDVFDGLVAQGNSVSGNEVDGGFRDTVRNDVCGAFDYHGFLGIETCAVSKETEWADSLVASLGSNTPPVANNLNVALGDPIVLTATDADGQTLSYAIPFANSVLGGTVSTDTAGNVTYTPPAGLTGIVDTFAFTVTDGVGGVDTAVVSVTLNSQAGNQNPAILDEATANNFLDEINLGVTFGVSTEVGTGFNDQSPSPGVLTATKNGCFSGVASFNFTVDTDNMVDGTGTFNDFDNCGGHVVNGSAIVTGRVISGVVDYLDFVFDDISLFSLNDGNVYHVSGGFHFEFRPNLAAGHSYTTILNVDVYDLNYQHLFRLDNFNIDSHKTAGMQTLTILGRVYDAVDGYVDVITVQEGQYSIYNIGMSNWSGLLTTDAQQAQLDVIDYVVSVNINPIPVP